MGRPPRRSRGLIAVLAAVLALAGLALAAPAVHADEDFDLERLAGATRFDTAAVIARATVPAGASEAIVASGRNFPDALAANYLAGVRGAPILLSEPGDVPPATMSALADLGVQRVTLVGGGAVLSPAVAAELEAASLTVERIAGDTRYDTAERIARTPGADAVGTLVGDRTAIVANGANFVDALVAGPVAYAAGFPIALSPGTVLGADAQQTLVTLEIDRVLIVGGTAAVSAAAEDEIEALGITTQRLAGPSRYATAGAVAEFARSQLGFVATHVDVATGLAFPDAIAGGPHAGVATAPIVLAGSVPAATCESLAAVAETLTSGHVFGGTAAVSEADELGLEACGGSGGTNQDFDVTPDDAVDVRVGSLPQVTARSFGDVTEVRVALVECDAVALAGGIVTFGDENGDGKADGLGSSPVATIGSVDGQSVGADAVSDVATGDDVAITVRADASGCVRVVVHADPDADDALDIDGDGRPTEEFGLSGALDVYEIAAVALDPSEALRPLGAAHTLTGQLLDAGDGADPAPAAGVTVRLVVERIVTPLLLPGGCTNPLNITEAVTQVQGATDATGLATLAYSGPADPSAGDDDAVIDCLTAFADLDGDGTAGDDEPTTTGTVTWDDAPSVVSALEIVPDAITGPVGTTLTGVFLVRDQYGDRVANADITAELFRAAAPMPLGVSVVTSDPDGEVAYEFAGPTVQADDVVVICVEDPDDDNDRCDLVDDDHPDNDADGPNAQVALYWMRSPTDAVETAHDSCVLAVGDDLVDVEDAADGRNLRFGHGPTDIYRIVTAQGLIVNTDPVIPADFDAAVSAGDRVHVEHRANGTNVITLVDDDDCDRAVLLGEPSTDGEPG